MRRFLFVFALAVGVLALLAAPAFASPKTFCVPYTGKHDYTTEIQKAFNDAVKAGPGSTVQLGGGHFFANNIVATNFDGTFKGAGEGRTVIDTLRGRYPNGPGLTFPTDAKGVVLEPLPEFFAFDGGHVRVSDLTFDISAAHPAEEWNNNNTPDFELSDGLGGIVLVTGSASSAFTRVGFVAHPGLAEGWPYNVDVAIQIAGPTTLNPTQGDGFVWGPPVGGLDTVSACDFENVNVGIGAIVFTGTLTVGGSHCQGNVFDNIGAIAFASQAGGGQRAAFTYNRVNPGGEWLFGVFATQNNNSDITGTTPSHFLIAHNDMRACYDGVNAWHWYDTYDYPTDSSAIPPAHYVIADNNISASNAVDEGMLLEDDSLPAGNGQTLSALVAHNDIVLSDTQYGGIDGDCVAGAEVCDNTISGSGFAGICMGSSLYGDTAYGSDSGWQIIGNDVSHLIASVAPIWLGPGTLDCTVIGGPRPTEVLDQGVGNILINVTKLPLPASASASPMGQTKRVLMKGVSP
jgi:hypothetical protein